jgi:glutaredoxin 3
MNISLISDEKTLGYDKLKLLKNKKETKMSKIEIYTTDYCPYCKKAKSLLTQLGLDYKEIDITQNEDDAMDTLIAKTGMSTVPQIFINDKFIGGCDDLFALQKSGKLEELL